MLLSVSYFLLLLLPLFVLLLLLLLVILILFLYGMLACFWALVLPVFHLQPAPFRAATFQFHIWSKFIALSHLPLGFSMDLLFSKILPCTCLLLHESCILTMMLAQCSLFCSWPPHTCSICQSVCQCVSSMIHIVFVLNSMDCNWFYRYSYLKDSVMSLLPLGNAPILTVLEIVVWHHLGTQMVTRGATSSCCTLQTWAIPWTLICS